MSHALVIGAGVSGLTTALALQNRGIRTTIVADLLPQQTTSVIAGALWEWPPAVCGFHQNIKSLQRSKAWARRSYEVFERLSARPETGVSWCSAMFFFRHRIDDSPDDLRKMSEIQENTRGFVRGVRLAGDNGVSPGFEIKDAYSHLAPLIDTSVYMDWLFEQVQLGGANLVQEAITGPLVLQQDDLLDRFEADFIINCSGLGARALGDSSVYPLRGALIRIHNDGRNNPRINNAYCVSHNDALPGQNMIYILPRGEHFALLGGIAEPDQWDRDITLDNHAPIREMLDRCTRFLPALKSARIDESCPVKVGLRPARLDNIRLEHETGTSLIHNYGHGGSGVTFSWGCAEEVATLAESFPANDMASFSEEREQRSSVAR